MQKDSKIALVFCGALVGMLILSFWFKANNSASEVTGAESSVSIQNGVQIIDLTAKGGYSPNLIQATAGVPTELHVTTSGTFDCSSNLVIPALGYQQILEPTGVEVISISADKARGTLDGTCGMGMYDFEISFILK